LNTFIIDAENRAVMTAVIVIDGEKREAIL